ncbi:MAG: sulfatase-like hydrolase/transferase [Pseudomonadota bacterium]
MNVLWIMCDQLRWDYLSCAGHPTLHTPHIDALAAKGVRFDRAYVQSPFCGPSRMSSYTGRYCRSHGSTWNGIPLRVGEPTLGDHLRRLGVRPAIVGKTHMVPDAAGMEWLGIDPDSPIGVTMAECGFEPFERDDGMHPEGPYDPDPAYDAYLRRHGFDAHNPWEDWANSGADEAGALLNGWLLKHSDKAARIPDAHSETAYMTGRAMDFMGQADGPWLCHLSFIKPHWPYIVSEPYATMYGPSDVPTPIRTAAERETDHPVFKAYQDSRICRVISRPEVREAIIPAYMGLIKQIDDHLGRLFAWMEDRGLMEATMIAFTSDHGDYLGDHWMGEKDLFHDQSVRVPLIVYDPRAEADSTRGTVSDALVEAIDLAPTFQHFFGGPALPHIYEGRDLTPLLHGEDAPWRKVAISEYDYATREARQILGVPQEDARLIMAVSDRWKYVMCEGFRPMLFDLKADPQELTDLGADPAYEDIRAELEAAIHKWSRRHHTRITLPPGRIEAMTGREPPGVLIGVWGEDDFEEVFGKPFADRP